VEADGLLMTLPGTIDFARVGLYDTREISVNLVNLGRSRLNIKSMSLENSDGTFAADLVEGDTETLSSGERKNLKVRFVPLVAGQHAAMLVLNTDSVEEPVVRIPLQGVGVDARAIIGQEYFSFGRIEPRMETANTLWMENNSDLPVKVSPLFLGIHADQFDVETITLKPFEVRGLEMKFRPDRVGNMNDTLLSVSPCNGCPLLKDIDVDAIALDRAVVAEPSVIDFGQNIQRSTTPRTVRLRNLATVPMQVTSFSFPPNYDVAFTGPSGSFPFVLEPDGTREFTLSYTVTHNGLAQTTALFGVNSQFRPVTEVPLSGIGGAADLCVTPYAHDFGNNPVNAKVPVESKVRNNAYKDIILQNCGVGQPLTIQGVSIEGDGTGGENQFSHRYEGSTTLAPGQEARVKAFFEPTREGVAGARLHLRTNTQTSPDVFVTLRGNARASRSCSIALSPNALDFGTVTPGLAAQLGVKINNVGQDFCAVKNIRITNNAGGTFTMLPSDLIDGLVFSNELGNDFSFLKIIFTPPPGAPERSTYSGTLQIETADPANPVLTVPLSANVQSSCVTAAPPDWDLGLAKPWCPAIPPKTFVFTNQCGGPAPVRGIAMGPQTTPGEFFLSASPALPRTLGNGENISAQVSYRNQTQGLNLAPLFLDVAGLDRPLLVPVRGERLPEGAQVDRFIQHDRSKIDLLFVVDNSRSMREESQALINAMPGLATEIGRRAGIDVHVGVTTTGMSPTNDPPPPGFEACAGGANGGEAGRLFPVDGSVQRILTQATPNLGSALQSIARVGQCSLTQPRGLEAMRAAYTGVLRTGANAGFARDDAGLVVVFVSDQDDHSGGDIMEFVRFLQFRSGGASKGASVYAIISPPGNPCGTAIEVGSRYASVAAQTGGSIGRICDDFGGLLAQVAQKAFDLQTSFALTAAPDLSSLQVFVNGQLRGGGWRYDAPTQSIIFDAPPAGGSTLEINYRTACQ
jgi:hypothetical protein